MATSGTYVFNPDLADAIDEGWERAGLDPENMTARHARSIIRGIGYMLTHWSNQGILQWTVELEEYTTTTGDTFFDPPAGTIDLLDVMILRDGYESSMNVSTRESYHSLSNKEQQGKPDRFYVERSIAPRVYIWPAAENDTDVIRYYRLRQIQDTGPLSNTIDIPARYQEAFAAGIAAKVAEKFAPARKAELASDARITFSQARMEDRERGEIRISTRQGMWRGRR